MTLDGVLLRLKEIKENLNENGIISHSGEQNLRSQLLSKLARLQNDTGWLILQIETLTAEKEKLMEALKEISKVYPYDARNKHSPIAERALASVQKEASERSRSSAF